MMRCAIIGLVQRSKHDPSLDHLVGAGAKAPLVSHPRNDAMRLIKFEPGTVFGDKPRRRYPQGPLRRMAKVTTPMVR
jgi:hypothetical protein